MKLVGNKPIDLDEIQIIEKEEIDYVKTSVTPEVDLSRLDRLQVCPRCKKPLVPALSLNGGESSRFKECPACGTLVNTFRPLPHQTDLLTSPKRFKMSAGGYGCGKSEVDIQYVIKHLLLIPRARVCVAARTYPALEPTFLEEFKNCFPQKLLKGKNEQKHEFYLTNGSVLLIRSFDDPTKLKSMNLTLAVIVEASDIQESGFDMFKSRIRNAAAMIPYYNNDGSVRMEYDPITKTNKIKYRVDARHILLETNPASNWVKKFLEDSSDIRYYGTAHNEGYKINKDPDENKFSAIISTDTNPYLPEDYIKNLSKGKSKAWIAQFLYGSFNFNDNLVFPNFGLCIKEPHKLPNAFDESGKRVLYYAIGLDYGIVDNTHIIYAAISLEEHKLYVYDELRINNADVKTIANEYRRNTKTNGTDLNWLLMLPRFDGKSYNKREADLKTIGGAFEAEGLFFEPSFSQHEIRIIKVNSLINHGQLEVFSTCEYFIEEMLNYSWQLDKNGSPTKTPKDGRDHGITAFEFIVVELPHNLQELELSSYIEPGVKFVHDKQNDSSKDKIITKLYNPLEEEDDDSNSYFSNNRYNISRHSYSSDVVSYCSTPKAIEDYDGDDDEDRGLGFYIPE